MPPKGILDGHPQGNVGCKNLLQALRRIKPLMHYFGHIHEGNGVEVVHWADEESGGSNLANREQDWWRDHENKGKLGNTYPESMHFPIIHGQQTLMVNAAIMDAKNRPTNADKRTARVRCFINLQPTLLHLFALLRRVRATVSKF